MTNTALVTISLEALRMFLNEEYEHSIMLVLSFYDAILKADTERLVSPSRGRAAGSTNRRKNAEVFLIKIFFKSSF